MLDCSCDFDPADFYFVTKPRARKRFKCCECSGHIEPGEQYERVFASWEGCPTLIRTCERCHDIRVWVKNNVPCFCFAHEGLKETAFEAVEDAQQRAPAETIGLRFGLLRRFALRDKLNRERRASA